VDFGHIRVGSKPKPRRVTVLRGGNLNVRVTSACYLTLLPAGFLLRLVSLDGLAPGGNLLLSQRRAEAVEKWLTAHGVAAGRLQAFGYGDTDPIAPDKPQGQPLNRRVVVVLDPAVSS